MLSAIATTREASDLFNDVKWKTMGLHHSDAHAWKKTSSQKKEDGAEVKSQVQLLNDAVRYTKHFAYPDEDYTITVHFKPHTQNPSEEGTYNVHIACTGETVFRGSGQYSHGFDQVVDLCRPTV